MYPDELGKGQNDHNPTPWAALAFHALEAILEIAVVPLAVLVIPFHPAVLLAFAAWSLLWIVLGHAGYELFPSGFVKHPVFKWFNTATHHNMHLKSRGNCSLHFNFRENMMGTNFPDYEATFEGVKSGAIDNYRVDNSTTTVHSTLIRRYGPLPGGAVSFQTKKCTDEKASNLEWYCSSRK